MATVLIVDDEPNIRRMVGALLTAEGHEIREAANGAQALAKVADEDPDAILLDLMMPGELDGMATLARLRITHPDIAVIMMSGRAGLSDAVNATKLGAINFLEKPLTPEGVLFAIGAALELRQSRRVARELREELGLAGDMVGESPQMKAVRELIDRVAASDARVLITGESGTGKELVASAIHDASTRRDKPFVRVNCAAIPRDLVESEMFGHERGSFTGATQARVGRFELAHTGTLFLDEIGDLSLDAQAKLLRAIEAKEIHRVGGNRSIRVDVRIIAATNHDLARGVKDASFREDLFFRLNVVPIVLPPLRDREGDVPELVHHFSLLHFKRTGQLPPGWTPGAIEVLERHRWPGNVRELANIVERIAIMSPGVDVTAEHVAGILNPPHGASGSARDIAPDVMPATASADGLNDSLDELERKLIRNALSTSRGNIAEAARSLKTDRPNLYRRMKRLGITGAMLLLAVRAPAQQPDAPLDSTIDLGSILYHDDRGGLTLSSGKTYNRVEGLPVLFGPTFRDRIGHANLSLSALGIIRTAQNFHWDAENLGHRLTADLRFGRGRGFALGATSFDVVSKIEPWQLNEPDAGLAAFFLKRDYFDYFGTHGARAYVSAFTSNSASVTLGYSSERWSSRRAREVFALFRGDEAWRLNPVINDGLVHVADLTFSFDTRNTELRPLAGWFVNASYEHGAGNFQTEGTRLEPEVNGVRRLEYGRAFLDLRRYNRISPRRRLNARLVLGGWLHGDPLPLERKVSVGGVGTLPGFDFRRIGIGTDVGQCSPDLGPLPGRPAECDRVALAQLEYRQELVSELFDIFNRNGIRVRGWQFRVKPSAVAFVDGGRGWLVGTREGDLQYPSGSLPGFDTWRTDVGVGLDLGIAGLYVAKAVSESKEPANFFVRIRGRF